LLCENFIERIKHPSTTSDAADLTYFAIKASDNLFQMPNSVITGIK